LVESAENQEIAYVSELSAAKIGELEKIGMLPCCRVAGSADRISKKKQCEGAYRSIL
jgi:hypothetical protein